MKKDDDKVIIFGNATLEKLMEVVTIEQKDNDSKFDAWFLIMSVLSNCSILSPRLLP